MTIDEIVAALATHPVEDLMAALHSKVQPLYQAIFDKGHKSATGVAKGKEKELNDRITALEGEKTTLESRVTELQGNTPDLAAVHKQYGDQIKDLKESHKKELDKANGTIRTERLATAKQRARANLVSKGVDADYADVQISRAESRMHFDDKGVLQVMQDGKDIPFAPADGKDAIDLLVEELDKAVPPKFRLSNADSGAGVEGKQGTTGGGKNVFDKIRDDMKKKNEQAAANNISLEKRLRMPSSS